MLLGDGASRFGAAWVALCIALGIHVVDEARTDFLSLYNPAVRAIRARFPFLPLPTFTFPYWLGGLITVTVFLFALAPAAFRGEPGMRPAAHIFGIVMAGNGLLHLGGYEEGDAGGVLGADHSGGGDLPAGVGLVDAPYWRLAHAG